MKNKKLIRLTEADLHRIVKESVNRTINESIGGFDNELSDNIETLKYYTEYLENIISRGDNIWDSKSAIDIFRNCSV